MKGWRLMLSNQTHDWTNALLVALGSASLLIYRVSLSAEGGDDIEWFIKIALCQSVIYLGAAWTIFRARSSRSTLILVILFAAFFRLSILFAPPYLSAQYLRRAHAGRHSVDKTACRFAVLLPVRIRARNPTRPSDQRPSKADKPL